MNGKSLFVTEDGAQGARGLRRLDGAMWHGAQVGHSHMNAAITGILRRCDGGSVGGPHRTGA